MASVPVRSGLEEFLWTFSAKMIRPSKLAALSKVGIVLEVTGHFMAMLRCLYCQTCAWLLRIKMRRAPRTALRGVTATVLPVCQVPGALCDELSDIALMKSSRRGVLVELEQ